MTLEVGDTWLHGELCWKRTWMVYGVMVVLTPRIAPLVSMLLIMETKEILSMLKHLGTDFFEGWND